MKANMIKNLVVAAAATLAGTMLSGLGRQIPIKAIQPTNVL
jgi:hypothetical protein